jgi:hypothetical protein
MAVCSSIVCLDEAGVSFLPSEQRKGFATEMAKPLSRREKFHRSEFRLQAVFAFSKTAA